METKTDKPKTQLRMIFNDDCAVIDFLCDLHDREPLHSLQRFINSDGEKTMCLLYDVPKDDLILVVLYMAPFRFNEGDNKLTLYAHPDLQVIMKHFKTQWDATPPETPEYEALMDVVNFLYNENYKRYDEQRRDLPL